MLAGEGWGTGAREAGWITTGAAPHGTAGGGTQRWQCRWQQQPDRATRTNATISLGNAIRLSSVLRGRDGPRPVARAGQYGCTEDAQRARNLLADRGERTLLDQEVPVTEGR